MTESSNSNTAAAQAGWLVDGGTALALLRVTHPADYLTGRSALEAEEVVRIVQEYEAQGMMA